jgi:FMN phosphatase YigB (HAD superfamily)
VGVEKPHPEIFRMALERAGFKAEQAVFVGDTYATDMGGAEAAGLRGILLDRVGAYPEVPCPRISSLAGLIGTLGAVQTSFR